MKKYILRRLLWLPFLLLAVSIVTFTLGRVAPGDPVRVMMGGKYNEATAANIREEFGLNRPFFVQYGDYMWGIIAPTIHRPRIEIQQRELFGVPFVPSLDFVFRYPSIRLDFGDSFRFRGRPVRDLILQKMWVSAQLASAAMLVSLSLSLPLGFVIAHKQGQWIDPTTVTIAVVLSSVHITVLAPALLWVSCLQLGWVPCSGWGGLFDVRIFVPAIAMGVTGFAGLMRIMRSSTLDVLHQDFVRTAHSKGLGQVTVVRRHVARNAMIPIITLLAFSFAGLIGGSFISERIFGIPGIGNFAIDSIFQRDYPVLMAITLIGASAFVLANLLADIAYAFVDPRIRYS